MKKILWGVSALAISFTAIAGGGASSSWQPQVSPGYCVTTPSPQEDVKWRDTSECQEVLNKGYAHGVFVSGTAVYEGGLTYCYAGTVTPGSGVKMNIPKSINGAGFTGIGGSQAQWVK
ncbi:hypothetical protein LVD56_004777 [Escherichia coli]|nr:hypothetical protein [Escherichia coli]EKK5468777.1 hypothetical protein [Escherichia coli]